MTIHIYVDGNTTPISQAEAADGTFTISLAVSPGSHTLTSTAQAAGENESPPTAPQTFPGPPAPVVVPPPPPPSNDPQTPGTWANVTPPGVSLDPTFAMTGQQVGNYGATQVMADPKNPGTFYVGICYQGFWKSTDSGRTWAKVSAAGGPFDNGRPSMEIAPDGSYLLSVLNYPNGGLPMGCWKSPAKAGDPLGSTWRHIAVGLPAGDDAGAFFIDPADPNHVVCAPHTWPTPAAFFESHDAGETWASQPCPMPFAPARLHMIDGNTILIVDSWGGGGTSQRGVRSAAGVWTFSPTTTVNEKGAPSTSQTAFHGDQQIFVDRINKVVYLGGPEGIHRSVDNGANWVKLATPASLSEGICATDSTIYSTSSYASTIGFQQNFMSAPRQPGSPGSAWKTAQLPAAMTNGWLRAAVAGKVIIAGCWDAGLWRFVEA